MPQLARHPNCVLATSLILALGACKAPSSPCDPVDLPQVMERSPQVVDTVDRLRAQRDRDTQHLMSGQQVWTPRVLQEHADALLEPLRDRTGTLPAIIGVAYPEFFREDQPEYDLAQNLIIDYADEGMTPLISWYPNNPWSGKGYSNRAGHDVCDAVTPGTDAYKEFGQQLDLMADTLQTLKDAGVTTWFRPMVEMNGDWFWWGDRDPELYHKLWWRTYERLAVEHNLDNLVWLFSPQAPTQWESFTPESVVVNYPGDDYVDIVGLSLYSNNDIISGDISQLLAIDKPFGFSEIGPDKKHDGTYDGQDFVDIMKADYPEAVFSMYWHTWPDHVSWGIIDNPHPDPVLMDDWMINASNVPEL